MPVARPFSAVPARPRACRGLSPNFLILSSVALRSSVWSMRFFSALGPASFLASFLKLRKSSRPFSPASSFALAFCAFFASLASCSCFAFSCCEADA